MNVCTDSLRFAEQWFPSSPRWESGLPDWVPEEFRHVVLRLLSRSTIATASVDLHEPWRHMVLVEHAMRSQFDVLVSMLRDGLALPDGLICLAGSGEGLHGQRGRAWAALPGNIHFSVFLSPGRQLNDIATGLNVLPAVSLVQLLDSIPGFENRAEIKWINDIVVDESKLAGFLLHTQSCEGKVTGAVIGIGLNVEAIPPVAPTMFVPSVTALRNLVQDPRVCSLPVIFHRLLHILAQNFEKLLTGRATELLEFYRERSLVIGRHVEVYADVQGDTLQRSAGGRVVSIGDRLELILAGEDRPVFGGRLVMESGAANTRAAEGSVLPVATRV
jgi:biotin-[acetyl-CoA-carboxylase] ligase BirA-like protein